MAKLTDEAKKVLAGDDTAMVATSSRNGKAKVSVRGSFHVLDDQTIVFYDIDSARTVNNIRENPRLLMMVFDPDRALNCHIWGKGKLLYQGDEAFDDAMEKLEKALGKEKIQLLIQVKVLEEEVF
jgi:putative heme iron utilization protein